MEKPILFNTEMVQAILEERKTSTRRVINHQPPNEMPDNHNYCRIPMFTSKGEQTLHYMDTHEQYPHRQIRWWQAIPHYEIGDILWVRETWKKYDKRIGKGEGCHIAEFYVYIMNY